MNDKLNEEIAFYKSKKEKLDIKKEVSKKEILEYLRKLKKNMEKEEIKKAIVMAFIDSVIIYPSSVEIRIKEIPTYMDKVGGDERLPNLAVKLEFIKDKEFYQRYKKSF